MSNNKKNKETRGEPFFAQTGGRKLPPYITRATKMVSLEPLMHETAELAKSVEKDLKVPDPVKPSVPASATASKIPTPKPAPVISNTQEKAE